MGNKNQNQVQLVISHLEGCSGNFLGRLFADNIDKTQSYFRTDADLHNDVLAIDGVTTWEKELERLENHQVVVTHNFDQTQISSTFPKAKLIQIYPYTHIGNVLYNICFKKLDNKIPNLIDNYLLHIREWYQHIQSRKPTQVCTDFWKLNSQQDIEELLGITFTQSQKEFFDRYWKEQLLYTLNMPPHAMTIDQLVSFWKIDNYFTDWSVAWTIFVYELTNQLTEEQRNWSIDVDRFNSWNDLVKIQTRYNNLTLPTI